MSSLLILAASIFEMLGGKQTDTTSGGKYPTPAIVVGVGVLTLQIWFCFASQRRRNALHR